MRLPVDDEIYRVDNVFLGSPGKTLYWRATYPAYYTGAGIFILTQILERQVGIRLGFFALAWSLIGTVLATRLVMSVVDHDTPVSAVWAAFWHEVDAPRENRKPVDVTFRPPRNTATTLPRNHAEGD